MSLPMQLTRFEWNTTGKDRIEVFREINTATIHAHVYDATGRIVGEHFAEADSREQIVKLAQRVQFARDGQHGTNSDIYGIVCLIEHLSD